MVREALALYEVGIGSRREAPCADGVENATG